MFHPHILINCELSAVEMPGRTHSYEGRLPKIVEYGVCFAITGYVPPCGVISVTRVLVA